MAGHGGILDIVWVNNITFGQMEYREHGPRAALPPATNRIRPLGDLLKLVWDRYKRPMLIAETSGLEKGRKEWLNDVIEESLAAGYAGMVLHDMAGSGVDMPN